jgi:predicted NUDIX family NTP pyrophosphohydrolase
VAVKSAGILAYRLKNNTAQVLLVHPGGPFFANKDQGAWSIPKGEFTNEDALAAAKREFLEEVGVSLKGNFIELHPVKQRSGKIVYAWAIECDLDVSKFISNTFEIEWPPKSGKMQSFPEIDKAEWFTIEIAKQKINSSQIPLIDELLEKLNLKFTAR